jgi:transcriptional regulator with XRE-family HTH domain
MPREDDLDGTPQGVFGAELRYYRERAGLSQTDLAALVNISHDVISKIETGDRPPAKDFPERLDAVPRLDTRDGLARLWGNLRKGLRHRAIPGWFQPWTHFEAQAVTLRWYEPLLVPGLLQTVEYARAVLRTRIGDTDDEIEEMVEARIARQATLSKTKPPTVWTVLDEGVVRRPVGGAYVMQEQLGRIAEAARLPNVVIQVVPLNTGAHEGLRGGGFIVAQFKDHPPVAYQDTAVQGQIIDGPDDIASLMVMWDTLQSVALPRAASLELIEEAAKSWT